MERAIEELAGLGPAFDRARVATAWTVGNLHLGDDFQQLSYSESITQDYWSY